MNRRLKYVPMLCVCLIGMLVSCGTVKRTSGVSGNKTVVEEKDPLTPEQRRKYDYFFLEALRMKEKGDLDAAFEMYSHCLDIYPQGAATLFRDFPVPYVSQSAGKRGGGFEEGSGCRP